MLMRRMIVVMEMVTQQQASEQWMHMLPHSVVDESLHPIPSGRVLGCPACLKQTSLSVD